MADGCIGYTTVQPLYIEGTTRRAVFLLSSVSESGLLDER